MKFRALFAALAFVAAFAAAPAFALSDADQAVVAKADVYFDQVRTLKAQFVQNAADGSESQGTIYLDRPGRLRLEYQPPSPVLMVAKGGTMLYYDSHLKQVSYVDIDATMAGVLVSDHVKLDGGELKVLSVTHRPGAVTITITRRTNVNQGKIALEFTEAPFQLRQWQVTDAQGQVTNVTLYDAQFGLPLSDDLFALNDPRLQDAQKH